jgi:dinuclear metal center YbgI/SA1388 family protein
MRRDDLLIHLDRLLEPGRFRDYAPNGLQVEGAADIAVLATAATASLAACRAAAAAGAQALLVHHGLFWGGGETRVTGPLAARLRALLAAGVNLIAYHLPLDAQAEMGNNAVALGLLGASNDGVFGDKDLGRWGRLPAPLPVADFAARCAGAFAHGVVHCPGGPTAIRTVAVVTGAGQSFLAAAKTAGCDALVTGEASEQTWHEAAELGIHAFACGHHATENIAVHRLGARLADQFTLKHIPISGDNPL